MYVKSRGRYIGIMRRDVQATPDEEPLPTVLPRLQCCVSGHHLLQPQIQFSTPGAALLAS